MKLEHLALWVKDLEKMKAFYMQYFQMKSGEKYVNPDEQFSSYFLSFNEDSARIEFMHRSDLSDLSTKHSMTYGLTHFAISVGSKEQVDTLTNQLRYDGYTIVREPRTTGDGYYESVVEDCEGNWVEVTI